MKYETLSELKTGKYSANTLTYTFTFVNNIDSIRCLFTREGSTLSAEAFRVTGVSIENNILTVVLQTDVTENSTYYLFVLATVASY